MRRTYRKTFCRFFYLTAFLLMIAVYTPSHAYAEELPDGKFIVFVLDASGSMKTNDPQRLAIDSIAQLIYSLPSDYQVGFVAYNAGIAASADFVSADGRKQVMDKAETVEYTGYSDAGAGLSSAIEMFAEHKAQGGHVVLLSDGEIFLQSSEETEASVQQYEGAMQQAQELGARIHVIGLGDDMEDMDNFIFSAAEHTGGDSFHTPQAVEIQKAIDTILTEDLGIKQSTAALIEADGKPETVSVELPYAHANKVRVLLTSTAPIRNLTANFQADDAGQVNGERYSLIEMTNPWEAQVELGFEGTDGHQVRVNIISEYCVQPKADIVYRDEQPEAEDAMYYERTANVTYSFYDENNREIRLWTEEVFQYSPLNLSVNGQKQEISLKQGRAEIKFPVQEKSEVTVLFDYSQMPVNVIGDRELTCELEGAPLLPQKPKPPYGMIAAAAAVVLAIVIILIRNNRKKPIPLPAEERPEPSKYSYVGKLNIYVTRTVSGYDIPPLSFNLFRLPSGRVISMKEILESCDVTEEFAGAGMIYFKPGANRNLILTNNSDCTIMKNREILMKKKSYQLPLDAKVDITFEDEISELTFQYKELKSSVL